MAFTGRYRKLFIERMKREGRGQEWRDTMKQIQQETGKRYGQASHVAMRRMGYEGPQREMAINAEYLANADKTKLQQQVERERGEIREEQRMEEFEQAVRTLPDKAPVSVEIDWIRAHPAMVKRARAKNKLKDIVIDAADVLSPPHGPAPSKAAVFALQHWVNCPNEFFKQLLAQQKKTTDDGAGGLGVQEDLGLEEVERLLSQVAGSKVTHAE